MMQYEVLGRTGLKVSQLCFGVLPMGPLQANLPVEAGGTLILEGLKRGINFIDTAEMYQTYPHIKWATSRFPGEVIIASKSTAATFQEMKESVERCLNQLGRDRIDIFHIHAARDNNPLINRAGALEALLEMKQEGKILATGVASHSVTGIEKAAVDPGIDIIFPLINQTGLGILDGGVPEMIAAISKAKQNNKGVYAMKALGGGNLLDEIPAKFEFVRNNAEVPVIAVGMLRQVELEMNLALFEGRPISAGIWNEARKYSKKAKVTFLCKGCGRCLEFCHNGAVQIINGKAFIDEQKCLLCGYCSNECPQFAIRVI